MITPRHLKGLSLLELMIAMILGLFLIGGIVAFFTATNSSGRVQTGIARISENGRFASQVMLDDLRLAGGLFGTSLGNELRNIANVTGMNPIKIGSSLRTDLPPWVLAPDGTINTTTYPVDPGNLVQGYDCDNVGNCVPALPDAARDVNVAWPVGLVAGSRAAGTDVITVRYLRGIGATLMDSFEARDTVLQVGQDPTLAPLYLEPGNFVMVAGLNGSEVFMPAIVADGSGNFFDLSHAVGFGNFSAFPHRLFNANRNESTIGPANNLNDQRDFESRVFNFSKDFVSVTYFIGILDDSQSPGQLSTGLYRIENGGPPELIVGGVERMDFTYGVLDAAGRTHYLTAGQVQTNPMNASCIDVAEADDLIFASNLFDGGGNLNNGCLWRGVRSIEVNLLVSSPNLSTSGANEAYRYSVDGTSFQVPSPADLLPSGLTAGQRIRKEFAFTANLHNLNR